MIQLFILISFLFTVNAQTYIHPGVYGDDLHELISDEYTTSFTLGYSSARDTMYSIIDSNEGSVSCIYTDFSVGLIPGTDPSITMYEGGINCEHSWPQSMGASSSPMKSDMHHLRPCRSNVNSSRGNKPYNEINDNATNTWYWLNIQSSNIPSSNINEYSETNSSYFEPREESKGDVARSIFYFYTIYENVANDNFFNTQKDVLYQWHIQDPPTNIEINRTWAIAAYQNNIPNPFIIDHSLIERAYFYTEPEYNLGDLNLDALINVVDVVLLVNYILGIDTLSNDSIQLADLDSNELINIVDVVTLINIILN